MRGGFRNKMGTLHTWAGLVLSALLFAIFWTGTLSVFDMEIDRWMMPATRIQIETSTQPLSVDQSIMPLLVERASGASEWTILLPRERSPFLTLVYKSRSRESLIPYTRDNFHPVSLEQLPDQNTRGASRFIYPFHHNLTLREGNIGAWVVGIASMGMLCLLISGIVIHRKIFADFFTLRLFRRFSRANLDVHNLTGVVLLPFMIVITLSGLIIAHLIYFPQAPDAVYGHDPRASVPQAQIPANQNEANQQTVRSAVISENTALRQYMSEALGRSRSQAGGHPAGISSVDKIIEATEQEWGAGAVYMVRITNPGDINAIASPRIRSDDTVTKRIHNKQFSLANGELLTSFEPSTTVDVWNFIAGLHYIQFSHWTIRWLYFLGGLGACAMIATGLFHWTQVRNKSKRGLNTNVALMNVLTITSVTGIITATGAFLVANRIMDNREQFFGVATRDLEVYIFYGMWLLCFLHACVRVFMQRRYGYLQAWREQCWAISSIAVLAVGLNWITTDDHLGKTILTDTFWPVAGVDLCLLAAAITALWAASKLIIREREGEQAGRLGLNRRVVNV